MNKNESKYFNTAVKMNTALIQLLEKKDFEYITIKEICETAGVNRSTFYLHYENTNDLLKETTKYITNGFLTYFDVNEATLINQYEKCNLKDLVFITPKYITPYLTYIKENQRVFKTAIKHFGALRFENIYDRMFQYIFNPVLERFEFPKEIRAYVMKFYLNGINSIAMEWLENGCEESIETIRDIIIRCVIGIDKNKIERI